MMDITAAGKITGIRFRRAGKLQYFDSGGLDLQVNDQVVAEIEHGLKIGRVVIAPKQILASDINGPLKPVLRKATVQDIQQQEQGREKEKEALARCKELAVKFDLTIKLLDAESNLDASYITIYFSSENRVDFRQMVRELASAVKVRVELRQVGPRDEAKFIGGVGRCGETLCCSTFLTEFNPLSIKNAKEQNLSLNPAKISGNCGRLLCCLGYEVDFYRQMKKKLPSLGQSVKTPQGDAVVTAVNPLKETVTVQYESQAATVELPLTDITMEKPAEDSAPKKQNESKRKPKNQPAQG